MDVSRFKVIYSDKVLHAISVECMEFADDSCPECARTVKPKFIDVIAINEDGNIIVVRDEAWRFQFIPVLRKGGEADE